MNAKSKNIAYGHLAAAAAYAIFGINIVTSKDITICGLVSPIALFSIRAIGAALLFWLLSFFTAEEKVEKKDFPKIILASILGLFIPQLTFLEACKSTAAIDISIVGSLTPIFTMFIAAVALKEPITIKKASGVAMSFAGVLTLIFNSVVKHNGIETSSPVGILLLLCNGFSFACYLGIFRPLISKYSVVTFMKWMFLFSLLISLPFSLGDLISTPYAEIPAKVVFEIGFLVIFATFIAYFLIPYAQKNIRPTLVSMYSYLQPIIAMIIAVTIGMDTMTWQKIIATVLIFSGVVLVNGSRAHS